MELKEWKVNQMRRMRGILEREGKRDLYSCRKAPWLKQFQPIHHFHVVCFLDIARHWRISSPLLLAPSFLEKQEKEAK